MSRFERVCPEEAGLSSGAILDFLNHVNAEKMEFHSFMLLKDGKVVCERWWAPYAPQYRHELFSLSKSFTAVAIGIAVDEGLLTVDTLLSEIFSDEFKRLGGRMDEEMRRMKVKHLLTMTAGLDYENWGQNNIMGFLSSHVRFEPGTLFNYHTLSTYMLSAAITRLTGQKMADWLKPRLYFRRLLRFIEVILPIGF
jgi:CubicO group peptidase (beta-lactamase class C family)